MRSLIIVAVAALAFGSAANAKSCRDAAGKFVKCPAVTSTAPMAATAKAAPMAGNHPVCKVGVSIPCGNSCISKSKTCHKNPT